MERLPLEERYDNSQAYRLIETDLEEIFQFVEPKDNLSVYSHKIYSLFFRACTEFENISKQILKYNGISPKDRDYKMKDYFSLEKDFNLSDYCVYNRALGVEFTPFFCFHGKSSYKEVLDEFGSGFWYQAYNEVKHDRSANFSLANLDNTLSAVGGLAVLLFLQYKKAAFFPYIDESKYSFEECDEMDYCENTIWSILKPNP
ncbi:MAG: hypothetical protein RBT33_03775 [Candidatus Dojkabacteria bacterium]|jgi:hypothetical protein|nr:hypothetical protein [Candidatus Dojkabacteria bacterium]